VLSYFRFKALCLPACLPALPQAFLPSRQSASPSAACLPAYLHNWTLQGEYTSHGAEQNWQVACSLQKYANLQSSCARHFIQNTWFTCIYVYFILFLQTQRSNSQSRKK
jgi:hypothetical protein